MNKPETPAEKAWRTRTNGDRLVSRSCEALLGICSGIMADGVLNNDEIIFLSTWLDDHDNITSYWPGNILSKTVRDILADGLISENERNHLHDTLKALIGGTLQDTGSSSGISTSLPINPAATVVIPNNVFCFTGTFVYGTRKKCEQAVAIQGGMSINRVTKKIDYLVIGSIVTDSWAQTSFGRKIETAVEYQKKGAMIEIIDEQHWAKHL